MLLALAPNTFGYRLIFLLHIVSVVVAFSPAFVAPFLARQRRVAGPDVAYEPVISRVVHGTALVLAGLIGGMLVGLSKAGNDNVYKMSQSWVSIAFLLWFLMLGVLFAGLIPADKKLSAAGLAADAKAAVEQRVSMFYGALHLLFLLQVIDMIWKPGT